MKKSTLIISALFLLISTFAAAKPEPVELTRQQASDLFVALSRIEPGLTAASTIVAADNLNALKPIVESLDKGKVKATRDIRALPAADDREAKAIVISDALQAKSDEPVKVSLERIDLTPAEIEAAKIRTTDLAVIRQHLRAKAK